MKFVVASTVAAALTLLASSCGDETDGTDAEPAGVSNAAAKTTAEGAATRSMATCRHLRTGRRMNMRTRWRP